MCGIAAFPRPVLAVALLRKLGKSAELATIPGNRGHLDGVVGIARVGEAVGKFLAQ